ncbi:hypothetical protein NGRA_3050, partial [Nosema granulosis]
IPVDELNPLNLNSLIPENLADELEETNVSQEQTLADIRESARDSIQRAANWMIARSMWRNDFVPFQIGSRVLIRPVIDQNETTRARSLYEHIDTRVYVVT